MWNPSLVCSPNQLATLTYVQTNLSSIRPCGLSPCQKRDRWSVTRRWQVTGCPRSTLTADWVIMTPGGPGAGGECLATFAREKRGKSRVLVQYSPLHAFILHHHVSYSWETDRPYLTHTYTTQLTPFVLLGLCSDNYAFSKQTYSFPSMTLNTHLFIWGLCWRT